MEGLIACVICAVAFGLWRLLAGASKPSKAPSKQRRASAASIEQLTVGPRTVPTSLTFRQRNVLAAADLGKRIIPSTENESHSEDVNGRFFFGRRTVASLVRAGFLEYAPDGYRITPDGRQALAALPERSN